MSVLRGFLSIVSYGLLLIGAILGINAIRLGILSVTGMVVPSPLLIISAGGALLALSVGWTIRYANRNPGYGTSRLIRDKWRRW